jgi:hypothetical protein
MTCLVSGAARFFSFVMAGLDPAIHQTKRGLAKRWMRGSSPRMTKAEPVK